MVSPVKDIGKVVRLLLKQHTGGKLGESMFGHIQKNKWWRLCSGQRQPTGTGSSGVVVLSTPKHQKETE